MAAGQSLLIGRLHPDPEFARQASFAVLALTYLEAVGLVPASFLQAMDARAGPSGDGLLEHLAGMIGGVVRANRHVLAYFGPAGRRAALRDLDATAVRELGGWVRAQHLDREEPQIVYELAALALGIELPAILVGALRELQLAPDCQVVEVPDGAGYPVVYLSTLHSHWQPADHFSLFVEGHDAQQLAGWTSILLTRKLRPTPGSVVVMSRARLARIRPRRADIALVYNPVPWLAAGAEASQLARIVLARQVVSL
jgi:hypothetical protein